jgi:hypothetical protein
MPDILTVLVLTVAASPLAAAVAFAVWPSEARLALMRPLSLAALFSVAAGALDGLTVTLRLAAASPPPTPWSLVYDALAAALAPAVFGLACLTVGWLVVAVGMRSMFSDDY